LSVLAISQVPGCRGRSRPNKSIAQSLIVRGDLIPIAVVCPACACGVLVDWLAWGRYLLHIEHPQTLTPADMAPLTSPAGTVFSHSLQSSISLAD
jgi:hypothetical protein